MKVRSLLLLAILFAPVISFAQPGGQQRKDGVFYKDNDASTLSIFSENGEQFLLVLNGITQNTAPTSKIRVEGLPQYGNDIEIVFTDNRTPAIRKKINIADPVDGKAVNMTLKIERNREGYAKLRFHKCSEVEHDYHAPNDEYVMSYGHPRETTTTTTTRTYHRDPPPPAGPVAMDAATFNEAIKTISGSSFDDTKLSTAKSIVGSNYVNTNQVVEICKLFSFDDSKLAFAKFAYSRTVDNNNYFMVGKVFSFDADKQSLNDFISSSH